MSNPTVTFNDADGKEVTVELSNAEVDLFFPVIEVSDESSDSEE